MRVAWLARGLGPGGAERLLLQDVSHLAGELDINVAYTVSSHDHLRNQIEIAGATVTALSSGKHFLLDKYGASWLLSLIRWIKQVRPDVIHCHSPAVAVCVRLFRKIGLIPLIPLVYTEHSNWQFRNPITKTLNALTIGFEDKVICVSNAVKTSMGRKGSLAEVIVHGVNVSEIESAKIHRNQVRNEWKAQPDDIVIGMLAHFRPEKNHELVFQVAAHVLEHYSHVHFVFYGHGFMEEKLRSQIGTLGLSRNFHFLGYTEQPYRKMAGFDVLLLPSSYEGLPVVLMESVCQRLPVIATRVGGIAEMFSDREAVLIDHPTFKELNSAIESIVNPVSGERFRQELVAKLEGKSEQYDNTHYYSRIRTIYTELASSSSQRR